MDTQQTHKYKVGDLVNKAKGYEFPGTVVSTFYTTTNQVRYVVEMDNFHLLHIFNESQLVPKGTPTEIQVSAMT